MWNYLTIWLGEQTSINQLWLWPVGYHPVPDFSPSNLDPPWVAHHGVAGLQTAKQYLSSWYGRPVRKHNEFQSCRLTQCSPMSLVYLRTLGAQVPYWDICRPVGKGIVILVTESSKWGLSLPSAGYNPGSWTDGFGISPGPERNSNATIPQLSDWTPRIAHSKRKVV